MWIGPEHARMVEFVLAPRVGPCLVRVESGDAAAPWQVDHRPPASPLAQRDRRDPGATPKTDTKVVVALHRRSIPCLSRMTSKTEGVATGMDEDSDCAGQRPLSASAAGHGIGQAQPLKVETWVQIPLGLL